MNTSTSRSYCNHVHIPLDILVAGVGGIGIPDATRIYLYLSQYDRALDYGSLANVLGLSRDVVKARCSKLASQGLVERIAGQVRVVVKGLPDVDSQALKVHQALMAKKDGNGVHLNHQPYKKFRMSGDANLMPLLTYRFTDVEWAFLTEHKALSELSFWSKKLPDVCTESGLTAAMMRVCKVDAKDALEMAVLWAVQGAYQYSKEHRIGKLTGFLLAVVPKWNEEGNSLRNDDFGDTKGMPTMAERLSGVNASKSLDDLIDENMEEAA